MQFTGGTGLDALNTLLHGQSIEIAEGNADDIDVIEASQFATIILAEQGGRITFNADKHTDFTPVRFGFAHVVAPLPSFSEPRNTMPMGFMLSMTLVDSCTTHQRRHLLPLSLCNAGQRNADDYNKV
jgi:hypothetical protein